MTLKLSFVIPVVISSLQVQVQAQDLRDQELARMLADASMQRTAIAEIVASGKEKAPLLLAWTHTPPPEVSETQLDIFQTGLIDAFGQLKTKEAIPFLIGNISVRRWPPIGLVWTKPPEVILERMPAVAALISIGPEAMRALVNAPYGPSVLDDRLATMFVVSWIASKLDERDDDKRKARQFLNLALREATSQLSWAERGIKLLEPDGSPANR